MCDVSFPIRTTRGSDLSTYCGQRYRAWTARRSGDIDTALEAEAAAGAVIDKAANEGADCAAWCALIDACDELAASPGTDPADWKQLLEFPPPSRAELIARVDRALGSEAITSPEDAATLVSKGYSAIEARTWSAWILDTAADNGVRLSKALAVFDLLGPSEALDGFVSACQDGDEE